MKIRKYAFSSLMFVALFSCLPTLASAKDTWLQVRSKNFFLIGNASEKDIRKAATKLEQFRETFRLVFGSVNLTAPIPTNVVVFKSDSSYSPFKPKRSDGKLDKFVAGYFQSGRDVNYITLSTEGTDADTYGTIFHEYVHFIINTNFGKGEVPPWFNEGLAEYYQTFEIEKDQEVKLGLPQSNHLLLLQQSQLIPLGTFFKVDNRSLGENANHSRSIFYAQAWALIHYLVQNGKADGMGKFLTLSLSGKPAEEAFREGFGIDYATMEKQLRNYVQKPTYNYHVVSFKQKLLFDTEMTTSPLSEADSNAYLGDLLYHIQRYDDAEPFLKNALALQPDSSMANTSLAMVRIRQRKFDEAKALLDKALAQDSRNHIAYYEYAFLLSREGRDEFGYVQKFEPATAAKMRDLLKKAIAVNPEYTESYELLAFVNLVNNEQLDEAVVQLKKALKYQPGNARYLMRIAEIFMRQDKFKDAIELAERLAKSTDDEEVRSRATSLANDVRQREQSLAQYEAAKKEFEKRAAEGGDREVLRKRGDGDPAPPPIDPKAAEEFRIRALNQSLRQLEDGEVRVVGTITKIDCKNGITYSIKTDTETFQLSSKDFQELAIMTFVAANGDQEVGCNSDLSKSKIVMAYRPATTKPGVRGQLVALEFVPSVFRLIDLEKEDVAAQTGGSGSATMTEADFAEDRRRGMIEAIRARLRKPGDAEQRAMGFIEKTECNNKGMFIHMKAGADLLKLAYPQGMVMGAYTPEIQGVQFGCGMKSLDIPVVFVYKPSADGKGKSNGDLLSMEFVPKSFTLE